LALASGSSRWRCWRLLSLLACFRCVFTCQGCRGSLVYKDYTFGRFVHNCSFFNEQVQLNIHCKRHYIWNHRVRAQERRTSDKSERGCNKRDVTKLCSERQTDAGMDKECVQNVRRVKQIQDVKIKCNVRGQKSISTTNESP
jgi:hypothetical protein